MLADFRDHFARGSRGRAGDRHRRRLAPQNRPARPDAHRLSGTRKCRDCLLFGGLGALQKSTINEDAYEGWTLLVSAVFVFSMVIWMNRHGGKLKGEIETRLQKDTTDRQPAPGAFFCSSF